MRPANAAGIGLGVEAAVGGVFVLVTTTRAHRERAHRRIRPVVRQCADDAEARAAEGAVDEGIAMATVARVKQLLAALRAGGDVWHDDGGTFAGVVAAADLEAIVALRLQQRVLQALDGGKRWLLPLQSQEKVVERLFRAFGLDEHALGTVLHPAGERHLGRQAVDEGRKPTPWTAPRIVTFQALHQTSSSIRFRMQSLLASRRASCGAATRAAQRRQRQVVVVVVGNLRPAFEATAGARQCRRDDVDLDGGVFGATARERLPDPRLHADGVEECEVSDLQLHGHDALRACLLCRARHLLGDLARDCHLMH